MMPDLKRLCEAAAAKRNWLLIDYEAGYVASDDPDDWEDIVRAVLLALREPSDKAIAAGSVDFLRDVTDPWDCMPAQMDEAFGLPSEGSEVWAPAEERIRPRVLRSFTAMIDDILADPVKA